MTYFRRLLVSLTEENAALTAEVELLRGSSVAHVLRIANGLRNTLAERDATIEQVRALADRWDDASLLWGEDFSLAAANIYAALESTP